ncbi:MAG: type II toxin-antitoxin system HicA family toxin [Cyclobacteriaceae bacterium]
MALGFILIRQKGGHAFYQHPDGRYTTLPRHSGRDLSRPLIRQILREIKLSPAEFIQMLLRI